MHIHKTDSDLLTSVYRKPTNIGLCLNGQSECPDRYKISVISTYVRRALTHCSTWAETHRELEYVHQTLINNGYTNKDIEKHTKNILDRWYQDTDDDESQDKRPINIFYRGYFHKNYKKDEKAMKDIIKNNVTPNEDNAKINFCIYYKNKKTCNLILKNNTSSPTDDLKRTNVVYRYRCPRDGCHHQYIGMTTMKLSKRISCHLQEGCIFNHHRISHKARPTRQEIIPAFEILDHSPDHRRLRFLEALHIQQLKPSLNTTNEPQLLPLIIARPSVNQ